MSRTVPSWLDDPVCVVVGSGDGVEAVAHELAAAGATIARGPLTGDPDAARAALDAAHAAARDPVTILVQAPADDRGSVRAYGEAFPSYLQSWDLNGTILLLELEINPSSEELENLSGTRIRANAIYSEYVDRGPREKMRALGALAAYLASDYAAYIYNARIGVDKAEDTRSC